MTINLLAVLVSLAMMLTGASGAEQPALTAKTLTISNVVVTYGDETVELKPTVSLGAQTDGESALFDFAVNLDGEKLFPVQLAASGEALTALLVNSDTAVSVPAEALETLINQAMEQQAGQMDEESQKVMDYMTNEFFPAYTALLEAIQDPDMQAEINEKAQEVFDTVVDRGEGTPAKVDIDGAEYDVTAYSYTLDGVQLGELIDALLASNEVFDNYAKAMFGMYAMMPEESGLNGIQSYTDLMTMSGVNMTMAIDEQVSREDSVDITDAVLTIEIPQEAIAMEEDSEDDEDAEEAPALPPIVMNVHAVQVGEKANSTFDCDYAVEEEGVRVTVNGTSEQDGAAQSMVMGVEFQTPEDGDGSISVDFSITPDEATGDLQKLMNMAVSDNDGSGVTATFTGLKHADGSAENHIGFSADIDGQAVALSFDANVTLDAIEDGIAGHEVIEINDLSDEAMNALVQDQGFAGQMMQVMGTFTADAGKLMGDESVAQLVNLFSYTDDYEVDSSDDGYSGDDDGILAFGEPNFTYLPEGWKIDEKEVDTAYDNVQVTLSDAEGENYIYTYFYQSYGDATTYALGEDGSVTAVEGRAVNISNPYEGSWSAEMTADGVRCSLNAYAEDLDLETIGQILAGIQY